MKPCHSHHYRHRSPSTGSLLTLVALMLCHGCSATHSERGVETHWHDALDKPFQSGVTTRQSVLKALGPPSQIVTMAHETALYYMLERSSSKAVTLIVYNYRKELSTYDRAVFFFDHAGILTEFAYTEARE